jgi:hypothetical protein
MKTRSLSIILLFFLMLGACQKEQVTEKKGDLPDKIKKLTELNQKIFGMRSRGLEHLYWVTASAKKKKSTAKSALFSDGDSTSTDTTWIYTDSSWVDSSWVYTDSTWVWCDSSDVWVDSSDVWVDSSGVWTDSSDVWCDSSWIDSAFIPVESCAMINTYVDDEGYFVTVMDYGDDGCSEGGILIKGKITTKVKESDESFEMIEIYENYSMGDFSMNGYWSSSSTGTWQWPEDGDSIAGNFEMTYTTSEEMTITWEDGETVTSKGTYTEKYTSDNQYVITQAEFTYESSIDGKFTYKVLSPVVIDMNCSDSFVPVSGIEEWTENENTYVIDYGDGTCDNLATVTENGETYTVDFGEIWDDEEGGQPVDSSSVNP